MRTRGCDAPIGMLTDADIRVHVRMALLKGRGKHGDLK